MLSRQISFALMVLYLGALPSAADTLPAKWEELTGPDFVKAIAQAEHVCALPFGVIEKHGPAGPLGTDLINVRHATLLATEQAYAVVFPEYYAGQIFEAKHQPGTIAYSPRLQLELMEETVTEMARNGCRKILIVNGHGGNISLVQYFIQTQLQSPRHYIVYALAGIGAPPQAAAPAPPPAAKPSRPGVDGHAGEGEISNVMASRPDLVHADRSGTESGADLNRLPLMPGLTTGIQWYARFPNHYSGDSAGATAGRGEAQMATWAARIAEAIRVIKADEVGPRLQQEFFDASPRPLETNP